MGTVPATTEAPSARATGVRHVVLGGLCIAVLIAYVHRNSIGVAEKEVRADLGLSERQMGVAMSAFFFSYAVLQIPGGWLAQVWGTRRLLPFCSALSAAATGAIGAAGGLVTLLLSRLGMGAAQAGMLPCATNTVSRWLPDTRRAVASGVIGSSLSVGGAAGAALTGVLLGSMNWRWVFALYALPGLAWAVWFYLWFRDRPEDHPGVNAAEWRIIRGPIPVVQGQGRTEAKATPWRAIFTSAATWWICGQQFCRAAGYVFYASWFATFLREARGVSLRQAGLLTSMPLLGVVLGGLAGGVASDWILTRTGSRRLGRQLLAAASLTACALFILLARGVADAWPAVLLITAGSFCSALGGPCAYAITIDMGGPYVAPVFATMNMAGNVGAALFPLAVPFLVGAGRNWDLVLVVFAALHLAGAACWLCLNPNGTVVRQSPETARN